MLSKVESDHTATVKWLSVVGIGEDGVAGLGETARSLISDSEFVFGGKRHLELARSIIRGEARVWPTPFDSEMEAVLALKGRNVCVLASGDPFFFGVGATLARVIPAEEMRVVPAASAFSLAASRLGWALQDTETVSLHGRSLDLLRGLLHPGRNVLVLTSDAEGPMQVARLLTDKGFGPSKLIVLEALGGDGERVRSAVANEASFPDVNALNIVAIQVQADADARILPLTPGLADDLFEHDGQITKHEIRAVTLSALAPRRGELLWDIGGGSGSVSIEWMLADPSMRAIAIEQNVERAAGIRRNASVCGVPGLKVIEGTAPEALTDLPTPDVIFIGGGGSEVGAMDSAIAALRAGGRLVANAVTLEMESVLFGLHREYGGSLIRIAISRAQPIGSMLGWRGAMPVTQWRWVKS